MLRLFSSSQSHGNNPYDQLPDAITEIYKKAQNGHVLEQVLWGKILLNSTHLPPDAEGARRWFLIAAQAHYGPAHNMLGRCSQFGWGCALDLAEAVAYYRRAAELGDLWGQYNLGICTLRGLGTESDRKQAFLLFRKAALAGHAKSMNLLARFLEEGWETERNPQEALIWYQRAAEGGDYRGQHNYATALMAQNKGDQALHWWRLAVEEATPDILLAMERELSRCDAPQDHALRARVAERLASHQAALTKSTGPDSL